MLQQVTCESMCSEKPGAEGMCCMTCWRGMSGQVSLHRWSAGGGDREEMGGENCSESGFGFRVGKVLDLEIQVIQQNEQLNAPEISL